jgi:quercetin dioxygenase-like cupin family protein
MASAPIVMGANERPTPLDMGGEEITVLASAAQTHGYEVFLQVGAEGSGPPPHHHPWDEAFYVVRGEVVFGADGQESTLGAGSFVHIPGGATHWFRLGAGGAEMVSFTSHEGATGFFTAISRGALPPAAGLADIIRIAATHGATVLPPST